LQIAYDFSSTCFETAFAFHSREFAVLLKINRDQSSRSYVVYVEAGGDTKGKDAKADKTEKKEEKQASKDEKKTEKEPKEKGDKTDKKAEKGDKKADKGSKKDKEVQNEEQQ
jgi:hypothetical protein